LGRAKEKTRVCLELRSKECEYFIMKKVTIVLTLILGLLSPVQASAATAKAGATCAKLKATQVVGAKRFTCIKSGKKLFWDKGVTIPKTLVKKPQEIGFPEIDARYLIERRIAITPGVTTGGLPVVITGSGACSFDVATSEIVLGSLGSCALTASQSGNANFLPATPITRTFEIKKVVQVIKAPEVADQDLQLATSYKFEFPQVGSSVPFTLGSRTSDICTVSGYEVLFLKIGSCVLTFNKGGDAYYEPSIEAVSTFKLFTSANQPTTPSVAPSPSVTQAPKVQPTPPPHAGTAEDPQPINTFLTKSGIKVKVNKVTDKVSELVCKTELIHDGCDFGGAVDADSASRFVEIVITVVNNGTDTWIPAIFGLFKDDEYFGGEFIVDGDIPGIIELEVGQSVTLNAYSAIPQEVKLKDCLFFISESSAEEAFFLKVD
jgi:hypothetical protein